MSLPLEGLLVADFSHVPAGPLAATMLADLGAIVIKVERPRVGDDTRQWGLHGARLVRSERSAASARAGAAGGRPAEELPRRRLARKGLGYDQVAAENPRIVYASITGFGRHGDKTCLVLGIPGTADDVRFASNGARVTNRDDLLDLLEEALAVDTVDAWTTRLATASVPAGRVGSIADAFELAERLGL